MRITNARVEGRGSGHPRREHAAARSRAHHIPTPCARVPLSAPVDTRGAEATAPHAARARRDDAPLSRGRASWTTAASESGRACAIARATPPCGKTEASLQTLRTPIRPRPERFSSVRSRPTRHGSRRANPDTNTRRVTVGVVADRFVKACDVSAYCLGPVRLMAGPGLQR